MNYQANLYEMNIKDQIKLLLTFKSKLNDHKIPEENNIYRLHHIRYCKDLMGISHETHCFFEPFKFPKGMTREEGLKVLSYLTDFLEENYNVSECSLKSVNLLEDAINLERFGFERVEIENNKNIVDLFTIEGRIKRFKISEYYPKYFNWYKENVSKDEIESIYEKIGIEFKDTVINKQKVKTR